MPTQQTSTAHHLSHIAVCSLFIVHCLLFFVLCSFPVHAQSIANDALGVLNNDVVGQTGVAQTTVPIAMGEVIRMIFGAMGLIFFVLMVYAGIQWFISRGEEEQVKKAQQTITRAIIGLLISIGAYGAATLITSGYLNGQSFRAPESNGGTVETNAGDEILGCCFVRVSATGNNRRGIWTFYMKSLNQCDAMEQNPDPTFTEFGSFVPDTDARGCQKILQDVYENL